MHKRLISKEEFKKIIVEKIKYNRKTLDRFLGYGSRKIPPIINKKIEEEMGVIENYLDIEYEYKVFEEDGHKNAFIIYTVGNEIEHLIKSYTENTESIRAMIMDKLSIVGLDCIKDFIIDEIQKETGMYVVKEIYPGNKEFPLENQKLILDSMENIKKISINDYYQLFPVKSVALKLELSKEPREYSRCEDCENPCEIQQKQSDWKEYKELYYSDRDELHKRIEKNSETPYEDMHELLRELSKDALKRYREEKIPDSIYYDTMSDIDIWAQDYKSKHGVYGIEEYKWIEKSIDMKVFKIGRLQFEKIEDEETSELLLNTHIQSGESLDFEKCQESYRKAAEFFSKREDKKSTIVFVCDSWLMNPKIQKLLSPDSNIIKFQNQYKIISEDIENRQMEERVFGTIEENPERYIATTNLQKNLKQALIQGERFGTAKGSFVYKIAKL